MSDDRKPDDRRPAGKKAGLRDLVGRAVDRLGEWLSPAPAPTPVPIPAARPGRRR